MSVLLVFQGAMPIVTLALFALAMLYFRQSRQCSAAKTWMVYSAWACGALQLAAILFWSCAGEALRWTGIALDGGAIGLFWWSLAAHGNHQPAFAFIRVKPSVLTRTGPYRFVRHPIYAAYLLGWVAGAAVSGQAWLLVTAAWMGAFYYVAARQEEQEFERSELAEQYRVYRDETGMFCPTPRRFLAHCVPGHHVSALPEAVLAQNDEERS
jgi:protein-S-isoprenylcysteine O-methyltransferase Ste14